MNFQDVLLIEPRLIDLLKDVRDYAAAGPEYWEFSQKWYRDFKPRMVKLIGFEAENEKLNSTEVYDMFYQYFINVMGA
jgi:hypothetical protein